MKLLLTDTRSAAIIDGYLSDYKQFKAGVRQGCPLAPLLYLLVAQAALSWLKHKNIGVQVDGRLLTGAQFADDLKVLLEGPAQVAAFKEAMSVFAAASGQHMLAEKTHLLPIGKAPDQPLPASIEGLPVVEEVKALGVTFAAFTGEASVNWKEIIEKGVHDRVQKIVKCSLSPFGRAFAVNGYALSKFLYHAQFVGLPKGSLREYLDRLVAAAVDRDMCLRLPGEAGPSQRQFTCVSKELLVGHPKTGGMGLMPLEEQVTSQLAWWGCRLLTGPDTVPWIYLGRQVLKHIMASSTSSLYGHIEYGAPRLRFLCAARSGDSLADYCSPSSGYVPPVLERMAAALAALPPPQLNPELQPGAWCAKLPLWSNPLLLEAGSVALERSSLEVSSLARVGSGIKTLEDLLKTRLEIEGMSDNSFTCSLERLRYAGRPAGWPLAAIPHSVFNVLRTRPEVIGLLDSIICGISQKLPAGWLGAAQDVGESSIEETEEIIVANLGWTVHRRRHSLSSLAVKVGTLLQLQQTPRPHRAKLEAFAALISSTTTDGQVRGMLTRIWKLPCDGHVLAPLWRLVLNGIPSAERMDSMLTAKCGCDTCTGPTRVHLYHECPILGPLMQAVLTQFQGDWALPAPGELTRQHLWLAKKPHPNLHQGIWDVIVVYLIATFDRARRNWTDRNLKLTRNVPQPLRSSRTAGSRHRPAMAPGPEMIDSVGSVALTEFWGDLAAFLALDTLPKAWLTVVPLDHPFVRPDPEKRIWEISKLE
jgi:hypothetical protein